MPITHRKRGKRSCRNLRVRLSMTHFVMQGRRRKRRRRRVTKNKVWENHYYLSFSSLPMLPLLISVYGHVLHMSMLAFRTFSYDDQYNRVRVFTGYNDTSFFVPSLNVQVCGHTTAVCGCKLFDLKIVCLFFCSFTLQFFLPDQNHEIQMGCVALLNRLMCLKMGIYWNKICWFKFFL